MSTGDLATLVVAFGTLVLAGVTYRQVRLSRSSLELSIRPLLADPRPPTADSPPELLNFGAPGRITVEVGHGEFFYRLEPSGVFHLSVAFENIGSGVAAIVGAETKPATPGEIRVSRHFVPVDATARVIISIQTSEAEGKRFLSQMWALEGFAVLIHYTDASGRQPMTSRASIGQAATRAPWIKEIAIFRQGEPTPIAIGDGSRTTSNLWLR